jgi:tRNA dimethylallyltransferase
LKEKLRIIAVVGPTAAGKTEIGIKLAQETDGEVISVDSMQIYRHMDIGTAKPSPQELSQIPHHLINILDPDQDYNAGKFAEDADNIILGLSQKKKTAILVGGTGLYIRALINGIIEVPDISTRIREKVRQLAADPGVEECYRQLKELDPQSAQKLHPNDISRISRALEIVLETGNSIQDYQRDHRFQDQRYEVLYIGVSWPRDVLYDRINERVIRMIDEGLVEETRALLEMGYGEHLASMNSIGYKQSVSYIKGKMTVNEMIGDIQQKSRRYAKKQITWYKKDETVHWLDKAILKKEDLALVRQFLNRQQP